MNGKWTRLMGKRVGWLDGWNREAWMDSYNKLLHIKLSVSHKEWYYNLISRLVSPSNKGTSTKTWRCDITADSPSSEGLLLTSENDWLSLSSSVGSARIMPSGSLTHTPLIFLRCSKSKWSAILSTYLQGNAMTAVHRMYPSLRSPLSSYKIYISDYYTLL